MKFVAWNPVIFWVVFSNNSISYMQNLFAIKNGDLSAGQLALLSVHFLCSSGRMNPYSCALIKLLHQEAVVNLWVVTAFLSWTKNCCSELLATKMDVWHGQGRRKHTIKMMYGRVYFQGFQTTQVHWPFLTEQMVEKPLGC